eukprot:SAG31_NODE_5019_length_2799_cov_2.490000_3_plen_106_part_00
MVGTLAQPGIGTRSTVATLGVTSTTPTTNFTANFSALLLFDVSVVPIQSVTYSLTLERECSLATHAARPAEGPMVTIELSSPGTGTVWITVDQSKRHNSAMLGLK